MLISLSKDPSSRPGDILAHVQCSSSDDSSKITYSHSFRYKVLSSKDGEIIIYTNKDASENVRDAAFSFDLEKCRNKECKEKNPNGCPVIAGKTNRLLVADVFHTMPTPNTLHYFGTALFKALFSGTAERLLQITDPTDPNGAIFLLFDKHDDDLDAIPWEYAKDGPKFLVYHRKFARVLGRPLARPQDLLLKPLRIVVAAPDPLDLVELGLADLHLGDQFQNFINELRQDSIKVMLERVLPATVNKMNLLLAKSDDKVATMLHFMGHCIAHKDDNGMRGLLFENEETFKCTIANTQNLVTVPTNLRLAFLSACNSREVARDLAKDGVRHTIGSFCPLPDDIARQSETQFYHYLVQGLPVDEAMWRMRIDFQNRLELRQSDYLAGSMILYSTTCQTSDNIFLCESGELKIELNMFPNNLKTISTPRKFFGRRQQLASLNNVLRRMVTRTNDSFNVCTITGIGGQGKTTLAIEVIHRVSHFFPGGVFVWQFCNEKEISAKECLQRLADILFPGGVQNDSDENLGQVISEQFKASSLLVLVNADTLKHAAADAKKDAVFLVNWLMKIISRQDISVKILATSQDELEWSGETVIPLDGFINSDVHSGCRLFVENLNLKAKKKIEKEENSKPLLRKLVTLVDGHPLSLKFLGIAASSPTYLDIPLEDIIHEHYGAMLVDNAKKNLEDCFGPMIDRLPKPQHQILYLCCLFTGPITRGILIFVNHFIDHFGTSAEGVCVEMIATQLRQLCDRGLLFETEKNEEYRIHIALREAVRQRNSELRLRLYLQTSGNYDEVFLIGVPTLSHPGKSLALEWLFHDLQSNTSSRLKTKNFCLQYYSIGDAGCQIIEISSNDDNRIKAVLPIQLIVFIYKVSATLHDDLPRICKDQVIPIVTESKLPFILVLDYRDTCSARKVKNSQMKKAAETLRMILAEAYNIIITEAPSEWNRVDVKLSSASTKSNDLDSKLTLRTYQKSLTSVYMEGNFIGRKKELETLHMLLHDDIHQYITIKGFGGIGKTCLALQAVKNFNSGDILALSLVGTPTSNSVIMNIAQFLGIDAQLDAVIEKLNGKETILLYLDNMEDIKNANDRGDGESKALMKFFRRMPQNVKILATSRVALDWPNEEIVELDGLTPHDGMQVFRQWIPQRNDEVNDDRAMELSGLVHGHSLSLRLLGGVFNNCKESIEQFLVNIFSRLPKVVDNNSTVDRHESINACIKYSFDNLNPTLGLLLGQLKTFEIPFSETLAVRALGYDTISSLELPIADALHQFWQRSWLNRRLYEIDPMLGDWRPRIIEKDTEFYSLHPRLRDFLSQQFKNVEDASSRVSNDREIQFYTAICYGVGFGVVNNLDKQIEWCTKAANNEHLEAQLILAVCYETGGGGVDEDQIKASNWYLRAAEAGDKGAQHEILQRFRSGKEVEYQNYIMNGYWRQVYIENKTEPLKIKFDFSLPLIHRATEYNAIDLVRPLLEQALVEVNIRDRNGETPLHVAASKGHIDIIKLLTFGFAADANATNKNGLTPTYMAASNGHVDVVRLLVNELGADVSANDNKNRTPLHMAALNGHADVARLLVTELGLDIDLRDNDGRTPLHYSAQGGHIDVVKIFLAELGADKDKKDNHGGTLLHYAAMGGIVSFLGADVNLQDDRRRTLLHWAVQGGQVELVKLLMLMQPPTMLDFRENNIGNEGACTLAESLKQNATLTELNLRNNGISDKGAYALAESLKQNMTLIILNLHLNEIGIEGACALAESLKQNMTLTKLNLQGNKISTEGACALAESLQQNITLTKLNLEANNIGIKGACALAKSLKQNITLTELNLGNNEIGIEGSCALAESLKQNIWNNIDIEGAYTLAKSLKQNITLTKLNLYSNNIGIKGACTLAESLKQNTTLTELNLGFNMIGVEGACALAESLKQNITLIKLRLEANNIGIEGACALAKSLKQNITLIKLNLEANNIGNKGACALAESLKQNITLSELNLEYNEIDIEGVNALAKSLKQNTTLTELNFNSNNINTESSHIIIESLDRNKILTKLIAKFEVKASTNDELYKALIDFGKNFKASNRLTLLHVIAVHGHVRFMEMLVGEFEVQTDDEGWTPLHSAAACGHINVIRLLVTKFMAEPNSIDNDGRMPLHRAADGGHIKVMKLLIAEFGAEVEAKDNNGYTPLHRASLLGHIEAVRMLIAEHSADVKAKAHGGETPLHEAAKGGHDKIVGLLVTEFAADVNAKDNNGRKPLHEAAESKNFEVVRLLIVEFGADINARDNNGRSPFNWFAQDWYVEVMSLLMSEFGADAKFEFKSDKGQILLHWATGGKKVEIMKLLVPALRAGANIKDNDEQTLIRYLARNWYVEVARLLVVEYGADPNAKFDEDDGQTPLHLAAQYGHVDLVRMLVAQFGVDSNAGNNIGSTPLHIASREGRIDVVKLLASEFDADIAHRDNQNSTPLHYAASEGCVEVAKSLIIDFNADIHAKDDYGLEPLGWAAEKGHVEMVKVLVREFEADLNAKNEDGRTPLQLAEYFEREEVVNLIKNELLADGNDKDKDSEHEARKDMQAQVEPRDTKHTDSTLAQSQEEEVTMVRNSDRKDDPLDGVDGNSYEKPPEKNEKHRGLTEGLVWKTTVAVVSTGAVICIAWLVWRRKVKCKSRIF